ncbi:QWRF motif-containing protein 3 isoform X1 [Arabidopsis lyrata subsp. lyrata]|uniref:QWRF motif-containing protein 3 isoform X1 n=1 Tax=Arabidopsis lyrata subsp. lyrata TaxID=81972 RepID=UPI000A29E733|nr:QWRF motif-containing protein 3 isoform X1 [Arabidopsis lyrata subsp. lyrata]|eukprot:XP_020887862.1 QWRF motif-containing protein 3 isoform X1 [Arabidopsis lyrata subsp. lyrata]
MKSCEHLLKPRRGKSRELSSRFLSSPSAFSSPNRRNSTSNSSTKRDDQNNNGLKVHLGLKKHDRMSDGTRVCFGLPNQSSIEVDSKENRRPSPWMDDEDHVILPGRFSVDECTLYRASSRRNSCSLLYESLNDESDSELSDVSCASSLSTNRSSRNHNPGIKVSSKYLHDLTAKPSKGNNNVTKIRSQEDSQRANSFRGIENRMKRNNSVSRYGSSMSQWALSPGRSLDTQAVTVPSSKLKPPRGKGVGKLINLGFDFFSSKNKSSPFTSPLKPKTCDTESAHQLKLMNNRLLQWRFVNARASAASNIVASQEKNQLLCAWDTLTKLKHLVLQERIKLQKKNLEMKLIYVLLSQVKHLEAWEDMERQHLSSLSMTRDSLHSVLSRLPLKEGAKVNLESAVTLFKNAETVTDAIISTVNIYAPTQMESIVPLASQLAEVATQEKLMLEQCHDLLRMISELEMQERSLKCCFLIQNKQTFDIKLREFL